METMNAGTSLDYTFNNKISFWKENNDFMCLIAVYDRLTACLESEDKIKLEALD